MSFLSDVATLIKAGYTKEDVKELYALDKQTENAASPLPGEPEKAPLADAQPSVNQTEQPAETAPKASAQPVDETDYKALYEAEKEKVKTLQNKNNKSDVSGNDADVDLVALVKDFC